MSSEENPPAGDAGRHERRRRRRWIAVIVLLAVIVAGGVLALVFLRETTTPVDVDDAVSNFRREASSLPAPATTSPTASTAAPSTASPATASPTTVATTTTVPAPGSGLPEPGVYTYATSGRESIDALGGRSHRYPEVSTITVTHERCGAVLTWMPLRERTDATTVCPSPEGQRLALYETRHEFFNVSDSTDFVCDRGSLWYPATTEPGTTWTVHCQSRSGEIQVARTGTIVGTREVDVEGTPVTVLAFELHDEISGASEGINERTVAVVPETGLIVELTMLVDVQNDSPIGDVHYQERVELRLTSLTPRR